MTTPKPNFDMMAREIMFGGRLDLARYGVQYRKGKSVDDVQKALRRARQPSVGLTSTNAELSMFELYLSRIFKAEAPAAAAVTNQGVS